MNQFLKSFDSFFYTKFISYNIFKDIMSWNYRVIKTLEDTKYVFGVHEVYYHEDGSLSSYTEDQMAPYGASIAELTTCIKRFEQAIHLPVLTEEDFNVV